MQINKVRKHSRFHLKKKLKDIKENLKIKKPQELSENLISFKDFCKSLSRTRSHIYSHINGDILVLPDKLNNIHKIPLTRISQKIYISKEDTGKYISINSQYLSLSDFSKELFNLDSKILWKKIKKDECNNAFIEVEFNDLKYRLNLIKNKKSKQSKQYYITKESYEEFKEFLKEKQNLLSNYVLLKDFFIIKKIPFKNSYYKTIKNNDFRFIHKNKLHVMKIKKINSNYYLDKEEVENFNMQFSKTTCFSLDSICSILSDKLRIQLKKNLEKLNCKDGEINLVYEDLSVKIKTHFFISFYFSKNELEKAHRFMSKVNGKTKNSKHLYGYLKDLKYKYRKVHKYLDKEKLILKDKKNKIFVRLKKVDDEYYFDKEDEDKIKKLFN
jgi:hypothetical protein